MSDKLQTLAKNSERAAAMLNLLANAKRLMVLCHLTKHDRTAGELADLVGLSNSAISQHLAKLRALEVVCATRSGKEVVYSISDPNTKEILNTLYKLYCQ